MSTSSGTSLQDKEAFFRLLDSTLNDSEDDVDPGREASEEALSRSKDKSVQKSSNQQPQKATGSSHLNQAGTSGPHIQGTIPAVQRLSKRAGADHIDTDKASSSSRSSITETDTVLGKRKQRVNDNPDVPRKLFQGLHFYFFPNNDVHPARRMRIAKATQNGAIWHKQWSDEITHLVADKTMTVTQVLKYLRLSRMPENTILVNEIYPSECLAYHALVDPTQQRFLVKGQSTELRPPSRPAAPATAESLPLKAMVKAVPSQRTPSQEESVVNISRDALHDTRGIQSVDRIADSFLARSTEVSDELDAAICEAKALCDLPLDNEDDVNDQPGSASGISGGESPQSGQELLQKKKTKLQRMEAKFQCMQEHTGEGKDSPNIRTIEVLQRMADYYGQTGDEWRVRAYRRAITTLRKHPDKVYTKEEAMALPNIGERLATKIEEIAFTNRLRRLDSALAEPNDRVMQLFMGIYGVGFGFANKWMRQGHKTLDDLVAKVDLTHNQKIGIEHYEDFQQRIPREEVEQHGAMVRRALRTTDSRFEVIVGGSYRRGSKDSGDVDCVITHTNADAAYIRTVVNEQIIPELFSAGFLKAGLAVASRDDGTKWHGASCLPGMKVWRRIDFLFVPPDELGAALIYFTGNDIFNRSLRLLANKKGFRLNQRGLYKDVIRDRGGVKLTEGTLIESRSEKEIFRILGVPWRPPEHRIC